MFKIQIQIFPFLKCSNHARDLLSPITSHEAVSAISVCLGVQACNTRNIVHGCVDQSDVKGVLPSAARILLP